MTQQELTEKHGTPAEFRRAAWDAFVEFGGTAAEVQKAIQDYEDLWCQAGRQQVAAND